MKRENDCLDNLVCRRSCSTSPCPSARLLPVSSPSFAHFSKPLQTVFASPGASFGRGTFVCKCVCNPKPLSLFLTFSYFLFPPLPPDAFTRNGNSSSPQYQESISSKLRQEIVRCSEERQGWTALNIHRKGKRPRNIIRLASTLAKRNCEKERLCVANSIKYFPCKKK